MFQLSRLVVNGPLTGTSICCYLQVGRNFNNLGLFLRDRIPFLKTISSSVAASISRLPNLSTSRSLLAASLRQLQMPSSTQPPAVAAPSGEGTFLPENEKAEHKATVTSLVSSSISKDKVNEVKASGDGVINLSNWQETDLSQQQRTKPPPHIYMEGQEHIKQKQAKRSELIDKDSEALLFTIKKKTSSRFRRTPVNR